MTLTSSSRGTDEQGAQVEELITLTIDDTEVSVPKGTLLIRAAEMIGTAIPRFCDHPLLDPVGACRQCLVEIPDAGNGRGMPKPQASCTVEVAQGMVVRTQVSSPVAEKAQRGMIELLLINHPLDCPICDKGGECPLQNQALSAGAGESRFEAVKRTYPKPIAISAQVLLDRERCVLCARCTRFSEQISGDPFIALVERGALQQVGIYESEPYDSYFSGNVIQICPVGALTSADYRFRARPFDLVSTPSVGEHDACGSAIRVDHRRGTVVRRLAGDDPEVNEEWITDRDRFAFRSWAAEDRLGMPLVRRDGVLHAASWPEAIDVAVEGLRAAGSNVGVLTGGRLTLEDAYGYAKFARTVLRTNSIDFRARPMTREEQDFLAREVAGRGRSVTFEDLERADQVLLVGFEPEDEAGAVFLRLRKAYRRSGLAITTVAPFASWGSRKLGARVLPTVPGAEARRLDQWGEADLGPRSVIMVGERAGLSPGALNAAARLADRTGARLVWVPRRAGDRGAVEAGCLPGLLPGGRPVDDPRARVDTTAVWKAERLPAEPGMNATDLLAAAAGGELAGLVVGAVELADFADPWLARTAVARAGFVVSIEARLSEAATRADVVFPIADLTARSGHFLNFEGRRRELNRAVAGRNAMTDLRILAALADAFGRPLGIRHPEPAMAELDELGKWRHEDLPQPGVGVDAAPPVPEPGQAVLASWRTMIDDSRSNDGADDLLATARSPRLKLSPATATELGLSEGSLARVGGDPQRPGATVEVMILPDLVDRVAWLPWNAPGLPLAELLGVGPGELISIEALGPSAPTATGRGGQ
ncbi:NADH-quinone oxidoreductase subunit G [Naumannella halotolerans]|uniref:NADH-quinone oxidoreductase n=1 Tax=Naumannella halotolerans TaxID=993414 RepID=A0A4R7JCL0_9ACTN|nr:NADH-quinone oxidoreductase subunit G [Naumannella halotolerans]TDT34447.1 NADH-quinone oxidoreductase subunit G [Naumannella halotolerans]